MCGSLDVRIKFASSFDVTLKPATVFRIGHAFVVPLALLAHSAPPRIASVASGVAIAGSDPRGRRGVQPWRRSGHDRGAVVRRSPYQRVLTLAGEHVRHPSPAIDVGGWWPLEPSWLH